MKKTILALAVPAALLVAGTAAAANVYKTDSQSLSVYGKAEVDMTNAGKDTAGTATEGKKNTDLTSFARIGLKGTTKLSDDLSAFGRGEWQVAGQNSDSNKFHARHVYMGLDFGSTGNVKFGQTDTPMYTNLMEIIDIFDEWGMEAEDGIYGYSRQASQVIYSNDFGPVTFQASYQFRNSDGIDSTGAGTPSTTFSFDSSTGGSTSSSSTSTPTQDNAYSVTGTYHAGMGLNIRAGYARQNFSGEAKKNNWGMGLDYTLNDLYVAALYSGSNADNGLSSNNKTDLNAYDLVAAYTMDKTRVYTGYGIQRQSGSAISDEGTNVNSFKLGAEYNFTSNFLTWVEYRHNNGSAADSNNRAANEFAISGEYDF